MKRKGLVISGAIAIVIIMVTYIYLGGLNSVEYTVEKVSDYNLVGVPFQGEGDSPEIEEIFFEARDYAMSGDLDGVLTIVHYKDTTLADEELKMFIGVKLNSGTSDIPDHYERLTIPATRSVRATIDASNVVRPKPNTIEARIKEEAKGQEIELRDFTIEQYISETKLIIDMPAKY